MDTPPDPHLSKALAHAPDRQATPPAHVSAQILAAAHRQAAAAPPAPLAPPRAALPWWRRPWGASGALATVLMAGFIGLLWRGEPPGPAVDGPAPVAQRVNEAPMAATAPPSVDRAPAALPPLLRPSPAPSPAPAAAPAKKAAERAAAASPAERPRANVEQARAEQFAKPAPAAEATQEPPAPPPAAAGRVADQALAEAQPAPPPASPAPPAPPLLRAHSAARAPAPLSAPTAAAVAGTPALRMATASLPAWRQGDDLAWEPGSPLAVPDAAWLQQLAALTQGHWAKAASLPPAGARLRWQRQGAPLGTLQWETGVVWWCAAGQSCLSAPVPPAALEALAGELASKR